MMMKLIYCPVLYLAFLPHISCAIADAQLSEYPYAVKITLADEAIKRTGVGLAVSDRYFLSRRYNDTQKKVTILTDQYGFNYTVVKSVNIAGFFAYQKVCTSFKGPKFPLTKSSFNDFSGAVPNAELIFFKYESNVLQKRPISIKSRADCATATYTTESVLKIACVDKDTSNNNEICTIYTDNEDSPSYLRYPMIAVAGQVHGTYTSTFGCNSGISMGVAQYELISEYLQSIISEIPATVIS